MENQIEGQIDMDELEFLAKAQQISNKILGQKENRIKQLSRTVNELEDTIKKKNIEVSNYINKSKYFDEIIKQPSTMNLDDIMSDYGLSAQMGNRILYILGVIKNRNNWRVTTRFTKLGITSVRVVQKGNYVFSHMFYNQRGRFFIYMIMKGIGIKPVVERDICEEEKVKKTLEEIDRLWKLSESGVKAARLKDMKEDMRQGFKDGVKMFVSELKKGNLNELSGEKEG